MLQPRTHFEQIPLEVVKKIAEEEIEPEKATEQALWIKKSKEQGHRLRARTPRLRGSNS